MAQHPTTEMAHKSIRVLQTVIIPTDLLSASPPTTTPPQPSDNGEGGSERQRETQSKETVLESKIVRQRLGGTALERQSEIWTKRPHVSLPRNVTKARCAAMMHMICWRGLCSNHRGLAVLTREYLNPSSPTSS